jgi:hypothetical protein
VWVLGVPRILVHVWALLAIRQPGCPNLSVMQQVTEVRPKVTDLRPHVVFKAQTVTALPQLCGRVPAATAWDATLRAQAT